jgi:hypothetical protein
MRPGAPCTPAQTCSPAANNPACTNFPPTTPTEKSKPSGRAYQRMSPPTATSADVMASDHEPGHRLAQCRCPDALTGLASLGGTPKKWAADILTYFDRPGASKAPLRP